MYLVKCTCGCFYTLNKSSLKDAKINNTRMCPNCGISHKMEENPTLNALFTSGIELSRIPDDATIEVKYRLPCQPD